MGKMLIIVGESGSGKTSVQKELEKMGVAKVVTYTTRPKRLGEKDGVDYHFVDEARFQRMAEERQFAEYAVYNGFRYGTAIADCRQDRTCAVLTPAGFRALNRAGIETYSVYLKVDEPTRLIALLKRGDDKDKVYQRSLIDQGMFDGVEEEVDFIVLNDSFENSPEAIATFLKCAYETETDN